MSRTTWRALRTELLRSTAPAAVLATLVLGALLMYSESSSWAGRWMPFAAAVRFSTLVLAPIAVALGAWQSGRERRRRIGEQVASTPRPRWQPLVVAWAGVTLGCWLGLLVVVAAGAALVAPVATYAGGGWWWLLALTPVALAAMTAVGIALGRAAPFWVAAPIAMIVVYGLQVYAHDAWSLRGAEWLAPIVAVHNAWVRRSAGGSTCSKPSGSAAWPRPCWCWRRPAAGGWLSCRPPSRRRSPDTAWWTWPVQPWASPLAVWSAATLLILGAAAYSWSGARPVRSAEA